MIALQTPVRPATGGEPAGSPLFLCSGTERMKMSKVFMTYEQQIEKLKREKGLIIGNEAFAIMILKKTSYYSLISGYKDMFKNPTTKKYRDGICFEDILSLYDFDRRLRELFLSYILKIENHIKSLMSYAFCNKHGESQTEYLNKNNYCYNNNKNKQDIDRLIKILEHYVNHNRDYQYLNHARNIHGNIPLWVLMNALTFGNVSVMYSVWMQDLKIKISSEYPRINEKQMAQLLRYLVRFRNVCAHGERLFSYRNIESIPDFPLHTKLSIPKAGNQYIYGKHDLFGVVIALKYMLSKEDFVEYKKNLSQSVNHYFKFSHGIGRSDMMNYMGFPANWSCITRDKA